MFQQKQFHTSTSSQRRNIIAFTIKSPVKLSVRYLTPVCLVALVTGMIDLCLESSKRQQGSEPIVPMSARGSHDLTGLPHSRRSGRPAPMRFSERRRADAEALEGAQEAEAGVLGFGLRTDDLGQLAGERQLPPNRPQAAGVLGALIGEGK